MKRVYNPTNEINLDVIYFNTLNLEAVKKMCENILMGEISPSNFDSLMWRRFFYMWVLHELLHY